MEFRQYDPTIGRFTGIDPVTHWNMSTYTAFDNNPVFWADPSGADSIYNFKTGQYVINGEVVTQDKAIAYANNGGNADGKNNNTPGNTGDTGDTGKNSIKKPNLDIKKSDPKEDIKEYEKNDRAIVRNSIVRDALSKLTKWGQRVSTLQAVIEEWRKHTNEVITPTEQNEALSQMDDALTVLGIGLTSRAPQIKMAATIISTTLAVRNMYLGEINNNILAPRIRKNSPGYYRKNIGNIPPKGPPYHNGGGGATGKW